MKSAIAVIGLGFGDEGKGTIVDSLVRESGATLVMRYNGGPQAAHHVVLADGRWHSFHQFGSGTFAGAETHLPSEMLVEPFTLMRESHALTRHGVNAPLSRISVDPHCVVVTPYHQALNRHRESLRGDARHGSCGMGVGEAREDCIARGLYLEWKDLQEWDRLLERLEAIRSNKLQQALQLGIVEGSEHLLTLSDKWSVRRYAEEYQRIAYMTSTLPTQSVLQDHDVVVFEGAQGFLLDQTHGFHPHNTWSDISLRGAHNICRDYGLDTSGFYAIGVTRSYMTRHGAGPFPTEAANALGLRDPFPLEQHNESGEWQGRMRTGALDCELLRYALRFCGKVDSLAVTHMDAYAAPWLVGVRHKNVHLNQGWPFNAEPVYRRSTTREDFIEGLQDQLDVPVNIMSHGPTAAEKVYKVPLRELAPV